MFYMLIIIFVYFRIWALFYINIRLIGNYQRSGYHARSVFQNNFLTRYNLANQFFEVAHTTKYNLSIFLCINVLIGLSVDLMLFLFKADLQIKYPVFFYSFNPFLFLMNKYSKNVIRLVILRYYHTFAHDATRKFLHVLVSTLLPVVSYSKA